MQNAATVKQETKPPERAQRMTLASIKRGKVVRPFRMALYAPEGLGKTTFAANAPNPVFLGAEDGTFHIDVPRYPTPETWQDVLDAVRVLEAGGHEYQTFVLDTLDWAEPLCWKQVCADSDNASSIEDVGGGFGKGYVRAVDYWRGFLQALERLQTARGMHVVLLAHSTIKTFKNPEGADFDRYQMKIDARAGGLIREWCDEVLFGNYETFAQKDKPKAKAKGVSSGARLLYTTRTAAYDAKNRRGLPEQLALDWNEFVSAAAAGQVADPVVLADEIQRKAKECGGAVEKNTLESLQRADGDPSKLAQLNNWVTAKLAEKGRG